MKVLQVIDSLGMGGAEVLVAQLHARFRERGIECEYYLLRSENSELEKGLLAQGARIHAPLKAPVYSPGHVMTLRAHLRASSYDVVHVHLFPAQLWAAIAARLTNSAGKLITTEHSTTNRRRRRWIRALDRFQYAAYRRIVCISAATLTDLVQWLPEVSGKVVEVPNGIDVDRFAFASALDKKEAFSIADENLPVVLAVGRLEDVKDHESLMRAISAIPNVHLAIVGTGILLGKLSQLAETLGISDRLHFLGARSDVSRLLKTADIYAQPSRWEGLSMAVLEALASGSPIVASNVAGLAEVVADAGLLFPAGDHAQLAICLRRLLEDPELRQRLSRAARERAQAFSIVKTRDCYEKLYRKLVESAIVTEMPAIASGISPDPWSHSSSPH
jgi:glycosyltransferase involved in cell wall biosynthesis